MPSWFSNLFTSPRERAAPGIWQNQMNQWGTAYNTAKGMTSPYSGVNASNIYSTYGVTPFSVPGYQSDVQKQYTPMYQNLATAMAKAKSQTAANMGANAATPMARFAPIDASYYGALSNLGSQEANQQLQGYTMQQQQQQFMADLLNAAMQGQQNFQFGQLGAEENALQGQSVAANQYLNSLSNTSTFGDIMAGLGGLASVAMIPGTGGGSWFLQKLGLQGAANPGKG